MTAGGMNGKRICAFRYFGGKFSHLDFLLPLFPVDACRVIDVFGGSGTIALNCPRHPARGITWNDVDPCLFYFFKTLRDRPADFHSVHTINKQLGGQPG